MRYPLAVLGLAALGCGILSQTAAADPPCGRGWRKHEACGGYVYAPQVFMAPSPVYVAPPPVYVQRPAPYPVYVLPGPSMNLVIPLR